MFDRSDDPDTRAGQVGQAALATWLKGLLQALPATEEQAGFDRLDDAGLTAAVGLRALLGGGQHRPVAGGDRGRLNEEGQADRRAGRLRDLPDTARALSEGELTPVSTWM